MPGRVLAYHLIWCCYGFWLPNDPRGSGSTRVTRFELRPYGVATRVETRHSVAKRQHDLSLRAMAKQNLSRSPVKLSGRQAREVARSIGKTSQSLGVEIHALSIMPDHVHLVFGQAPRPAEKIASAMKAKATLALKQAGQWNGPTPWARGCWKVFLYKPEHVYRTIRYVQDNPMQAGLKAQRWPFVQPYDAGA